MLISTRERFMLMVCPLGEKTYFQNLNPDLNPRGTFMGGKLDQSLKDIGTSFMCPRLQKWILHCVPHSCML